MHLTGKKLIAPSSLRWLLLTSALSSATGCVVRAGAYVEPAMVVVAEPEVVVVRPAPRVVVFREPPPLVLVDSNVYVVESSSYAVYYVDGFYWHFGSGGWYRAHYWDEPWVQVEVNVVPTVVVHRDHHKYVKYKPHKTAKKWREPKAHPAAPKPPPKHEPPRQKPPKHEPPHHAPPPPNKPDHHSDAPRPDPPEKHEPPAHRDEAAHPPPPPPQGDKPPHSDSHEKATGPAPLDPKQPPRNNKKKQPVKKPRVVRPKTKPAPRTLPHAAESNAE